MPVANIPAAKRAGLPVDLDRLTAEGDDWLSPEQRYALKTHGVCAQSQPQVFMVRVRNGGDLTAGQACGLADIAERHGRGWLHLTTRQQAELHHVHATEVNAVLAAVRALGLTTRSTCGHTVRGVMWCPDAGVALAEPFDCAPDAHAITAAVLARTPDLDTQLPSRVNIHLGGCPACRDHARLNDAGLVSVLGAGGQPGYELWVGGSLGRSVPTLAVKALDFVPRAHAVTAVTALLDVYIAHGNFDQPNKARMKFLLRDLGADRFLDLFRAAYARTCRRPHPPPPQVEVSDADLAAAVLAQAPEGGWSRGVRPQRTPGRAVVTVEIPLGDLDADDLRGLAGLAGRYADGVLHLTRDQDITLRHVPLGAVPALRGDLGDLGLAVAGTTAARDVRACTGGPVCSLAITASQQVAWAVRSSPALARNGHLRVSVSGCPNACAQQQVADVGFSGGKVHVGGGAQLGYQVWLGGDIAAGRVGQVVGRVAERDVPAITEAIVGLWEALRAAGESLPQTVTRLGPDAFAAHIDRVFRGRWESGAEPGQRPRAAGDTPTAGLTLEPDRLLPLAVA
ncbi:MAG: nitrite/sulfite reductase [Actinobacteria bacterium]|nr:nitrite/sulfite reductase [Actinomycetota bacterium]